MPLLLKDDYCFTLPRMYKVKQSFKRPKIENIGEVIHEQMIKAEISRKIQPGQTIAVAVGSRGIRNLQEIVGRVIEEIKQKGGKPYIISAMGSHGGGTEEGQREIFNSYEITEENMGVPIVSKLDVVELGRLKSGIPVYFDAMAYAADMVIVINRVKLHTDFTADIQSGLCKMLVIGLGNHIGCTAIHEEDFEHFGEVLKEAATLIMGKVNVGFGVAVVENAYDETFHIEAITADHLIEREKELVKLAGKNMPAIMIPEIDILVVHFSTLVNNKKILKIIIEKFIIGG